MRGCGQRAAARSSHAAGNAAENVCSQKASRNITFVILRLDFSKFAIRNYTSHRYLSRLLTAGDTQRPLETATTALLVRSVLRLWSYDVPFHDRFARFPRTNAGFAMESQSRRARCISIAWELVGPAHVSGREWMRFGSDRPVVWKGVGHPAGDSYPLHQHHWRSGECSPTTRVSATDWPADRRSDDLPLARFRTRRKTH